MADAIRGQSAVVGIGLSDFGEVPGFTHLELMAQSVDRACNDAGLSKNDIDGVFAIVEPTALPVATVCEYLGLHPKVVESTMLGGSSYVNFLQWAALALNAGLCEVALITYGSVSRSGGIRPGGSHNLNPYVHYYEPRDPALSYAFVAARHMHEFGTTREQLAHVATAARGWAQLNPAAYMRDPLTVEQVLESRMVVDPLGVRDCCLVTDGGAAAILVKADRAKDFPHPPAYLLGVATETSHTQIAQMKDLTTTVAARSGPRAFDMAGLTPNDVDVLELYDAFTINTLIFLEDLGYCKKGEGGPFVQSGAIAPGGNQPVNTNGGGLSCVHPGMYGLFLIVEAVTQVRGYGGERQVPDVDVALVQGNGGTFSTQVTALFGSETTL